MHLVHPCHGSLVPSTLFNVLALVNIIRIHTGRRALSISAKPGSAAHFSTSTTSAGLQHLSVGACVHLVSFRAVSCCMWPLPHVNISCTSQLLASLVRHQLEPCSPKLERNITSLVTQVLECGCGNKAREQCALIPMGLLVV